MDNFWYKDEEGILCLKLARTTCSYRVDGYVCGFKEDSVQKCIGVIVAAKYNHPITHATFHEIERGKGFFLNGLLGIKLNQYQYIDLFNATLDDCTADTIVRSVDIELTTYPYATLASRGHWYLTNEGVAFAYGIDRFWFPKTDNFILNNAVNIQSELKPIIKVLPNYDKKMNIENMTLGQAFFVGDMVRIKSPQGAIELKTGDIFPNDGAYYRANLEIVYNE